MATATCRTDGCGNADQPIEVPDTVPEMDADGTMTIRPIGPGDVACGVCGQPVQDVQAGGEPT
jgi:hypothetical protein